MSKLRLRLSDSKEVSLDVDNSSFKLWPFWAISVAQAFVYMGFIFLFIRNLALDSYEPIDHLKLFVLSLTILVGLQAAKAILGGTRFFPESKFDLLFLVLSIGLISTLLIKQVFDLPGGKGMLPNTVYWYLSILGLLSFMLFSYMLDIVFRKKTGYVYILYPLLAAVDVAYIAKYLMDGEVITELAFLTFLLLPVYFVLPFLAKNFKVFAVVVVNFVLLAVLAIKDINESYVAILMLAIFVQEVIVLATRELKFKEIKNVLSELRKGKINLSKSKFVFYNLGLILLFLAGALGLVLKAVFGNEDYSLIKNGLDGNWNVLKAISKVDEFLIGGGFTNFNSSFLANFFDSYGFLGLFLLTTLIGWSMFYTFRFAHSLKSLDNRKMLIYSLSLVSISIVILGIVIDLTSSVMLFMAIAAAAVVNISAVEEKLLVKNAYVKLSKVKTPKMKLAFKLAQGISLIVVTILVVMMFVKFEDIFILS